MTIVRLALTLIIAFLSGCKTTQESQISFKANEALVMLNRSGRLGVEGLPQKVFIFPALKCDANGVPMEQLDYAVKDDGSLYWLPPSAIADQIQKEVVKTFENRGYTSISFVDLTDIEEDYQVMVVNGYYSAPTRTLSDSGEPLSLVVFRLTGVSFPASMDPARSVPVFDHMGEVMYAEQLDETAAICRAFRYAVDEVGARGTVARAIKVAQ